MFAELFEYLYNETNLLQKSITREIKLSSIENTVQMIYLEL